jgi:serine/threonine protein kinase
MVEDARKTPRLIGGVYQVGQVIKTGPVLTVYTAYNRNSSNVVGLLVFLLPPLFEAEAALQLLEPLKRRSLVKSPHVIHVYDWGIDGSRAYIATDPPRGTTLRHVLDNETAAIHRAVGMAQQVTRGLVALQALGIKNSDLRPQLITVDRVGSTDRVQLDDVGLRLLLRRLGYVSGQQGDDIGFFDPRYMAPETIQGGQIGTWSDVYQVGLLLFELITGRAPFVGRNSAETSTLQTSGSIPRMSVFRQNIPHALQDVVDRALAKDPAQRFRNAEALLRGLETISVGPGSASGALFTPSADTLPTVKSSVRNGEMPSVPDEKDSAIGDTRAKGGITVSRIPLVVEEEGVYAYLDFEKEGEEVRRFAIKDKYVIVGRVDPKRGLRPEIDLTPIDPGMTVSRQHARIRFEKTFFTIEDLKSHNNTRLGDLTLTPLKAELLQHGDVLQFGSVRMVFKVPEHRENPS